MPFTFFKSLEIPEIILIEIKNFQDNRGYFMETYKKSEFLDNGIDVDFVQDNYSFSVQNVLRGLHFQKEPYSQGKLVMPYKGEIFDVAVDMRKDSPTLGKWIGIKLDTGKPQMLYIPPGFAHGFCVLSKDAIIGYKVTAEFSPSSDCGIIWNDPDIGVKWPIANPIISDKDNKLLSFKEIIEM